MPTTYLLAGDSTVAPAKPDEYPMMGWGDQLATHLGAPVRNFAFGGATTESFIAGGSWKALVDETTAGDTIVIQFAHNDQKEPALLAARDGFTRRLRMMIDESRARGASAVLCTPVERRRFEHGRVAASHGDYPNAIRDLAAQTSTPLIDLTAFTTWLYEDLGEDASAGLLSHFAPGQYPGWPDAVADDTHFQLEGARRIAAFVAQSLRAFSGLVDG